LSPYGNHTTGLPQISLLLLCLIAMVVLVVMSMFLSLVHLPLSKFAEGVDIVNGRGRFGSRTHNDLCDGVYLELKLSSNFDGLLDIIFFQYILIYGSCPKPTDWTTAIAP
ncbi:hypothetical protein ACJX0J_011893, partial [Zea mays]